MKTAISTKPPIGDEQKKVLSILLDYGYDANDIDFLQKQSGWLSVRLSFWKEIDDSVMNAVKKVFPKSYVFWNDDKLFRRYELILDI